MARKKDTALSPSPRLSARSSRSTPPTLANSSKSLSTNSTRRTRTTRSRLSTQMRNSPTRDNMESEGTSTDLDLQNRSNSSGAFPEVVIPINSIEREFKTPDARSKINPKSRLVVEESSAERSSSLSSINSNRGAQSSGYDTPGTSAVVTPAEPIGPNGSKLALSNTEKPRGRVSAAERTRQLRESQYSLSSSKPNKRKRVSGEDSGDDPEDTADARLARKLQDAENMKVLSDEEDEDDGDEEEDTAPFRTRRKRAAEYVGLSSDESVDEISSGLFTPSSPKRSPKSSRPARSSIRQPTRASTLPSRAARDSARKSIASSSSRARFKIEDSEESDIDLSELDSDQFEAEDASTSDEAEVRSVEEVIEVAPEPTMLEADRRLERTRQRRNTRRDRRIARMSGGGRLTRAERERAKLESHHPEVKTMWDTLAADPVIVPEKAVQPKSISRQLKSFQLEGLHWMIKQEKTQWKGGLLGDEMGMGKTIQAVSLIMSDYPAKSPTLVIVPPVALMQWQNEIREYTDGKLKVLLYHGAQVKKLSVRQLKGYDVLMTSYSTLEVTHRKERKGWSRKDEDGEKVLVKEDSPLHAIQFHRVILDEAHNIKSRTSGTAKACFALKADYKWCLSGTPLQNRIGELFSLLRFLEIQPFACYMCKACACKEVHWSLDNATRQCRICKHRGFDHVSIFNLELLDPIVNNGNNGPGKEAFGKLRLLTDRIMLRRMKVDHTASMELPAKDIVIHNEFFGEIERDFASSIMTNTSRQFDTYVAQGVMLNNYANIFGLIMQMRQVADHPDMILRKHAEGGQNILVCAICDDVAEDCVRSSCRHDFCRSCVRNYMKSFTQLEEDPDCPRCHIPLSIDLEQEEREQDEQAVKKSSIINRIKMEKWTSSTKIEMLIYELAELRSPKRTVKSIVFSQFTSMLQLVEWRLRRAGFNTVMLDGTMTPVQRQSSIDYFMKNPDVEVFLVSLKAGGVALNLTEASKVFLIDPWWNPAAEWQSADRCHRIGQCRPCNITRLCIEDSVESRMVLLQEKKANMINGTINSDETAMQNLSPEDMQFLFRGT
ncbi:MAG: DNA repair protein rad16 [Sclerophora amabilis]|nr:MAG: DNA repair protein rad16 [Sclerophora amabilis]